VTCLAVGQTKGKATLIYAGVNSSVKDQEKGKNEHFRVFGLEVQGGPKKSQRTATSRISELSRTTLFAGREKDTYQRVLRLSQPFPNNSQLGAAATGLASDSPEVVLFDTTASPSATPNIYGRVLLTEEAVDVDVIQTGKEFLLAYCTNHDVFVKTISPKAEGGDPVCITPAKTERERVSKPSFRSLRFLSAEFILMLTNLQGRSGVLLQVLRLPTKDGARASLARQLRLPSKIRQASSLAVCNLSPRTSPSSEQGYTQFVIAVAGQDISLSLFTMDHQREGTVSLVNDIKPFRNLKEVHPMQMTGLAFSIINPPNESTLYTSIKLASISVGNTVIVHTIPVKPVSKSSRYVVAGTSSQSLVSFGAFLSIITAIIIAVLIQSALEIRGSSPEYLGLSKYVAPGVQGWIKNTPPASNSIISRPASSPIQPKEGFRHGSFSAAFDSLISKRAQATAADGSQPIIILREEQDSTPHETDPNLKPNLKVDLHDETVHGPHGGKTWEQLTHAQKEEWRQKLKTAGHWTEDFTETILKGIVFGEIAGAIGAAVGG
jgi:hypothetical protein